MALRETLDRDDLPEGVRQAIEAEVARQEERDGSALPSEALFRIVFEKAALGIVLTGLDYRHLDANPAFLEMIGRSLEEFVGTDTEAPYPPEDRPVDATLWDELAAGRRAWYQREARLVHKSGEIVPVRLTVSLARGVDSEALCAITLVEDLREQRAAEEHRRSLEARLFHARKLEALGALAGGIAHDFNNLLQSVMGHASLARLGLKAGSPEDCHLVEIEAEAQRGALLSQEMLACAGHGALALSEVDVAALVESGASVARPSLPQWAALSTQCAEGLPRVRGDNSQLTQALRGLITNAVEALTDRRGAIRVRASVVEWPGGRFGSGAASGELSAGTYVSVSVADDGCGMEAEALARAFDPFFSTKFVGRGLGLAAVLGIARSHGGGVDIRSEPGRGTTVQLLLPAMDAGPTGGTGAASADHARTPLGPEGGIVLVADDEPAILELMRVALTMAGYTVLTAEGGEACVELLRRHASEVRLAVLDLSMPGVDGAMACQEMRRIRPDLPVLIATGHGPEDALERLAGQPVSGLLAKPHSPVDLIAQVRRILGDDTTG